MQQLEYTPGGTIWRSFDQNALQPKHFCGKEQLTVHGYNMYDSGKRFHTSNGIRFISIDPLAEKYYSISPYAYCGGNPICRIAPYGMDYWSTNDPVEIERFWNSIFSPHVNMLQYYSNSFNFSSWDHLADAEFTDNF